MAVVSFEQIKVLFPGDVNRIGDSTSGIPAGPIKTPTSPRVTVFDPNWGYYSFGQQIQFVYGEDHTYRSEATFTIEGAFTPNACAGQYQPNLTEAQIFDLLMTRYEALEQQFKDAALAVAPSGYNAWGTAADPRCILLPEPLRDDAGRQIYGLPEQIQLLPGQYPVKLQYRALLKEAKFPTVKLVVNDVILDQAVVTFSPPRPILHRKTLAGAAGEVVQLENWTPLDVEIQAQMGGPVVVQDAPNPSGWVAPSGHLLTDNTKSLASSLETTGRFTVKLWNVASPSGEYVWQNLELDEGSGMDVAYDAHVVQVVIHGRG